MRLAWCVSGVYRCLNESPSEKEGKYQAPPYEPRSIASLNESPSEKEGKLQPR